MLFCLNTTDIRYWIVVEQSYGARIFLFRILGHSIILHIYFYLHPYPSHRHFLQPHSFLSLLFTTVPLLITLSITLIYIHITLFITFIYNFSFLHHPYLQQSFSQSLLFTTLSFQASLPTIILITLYNPSLCFTTILTFPTPFSTTIFSPHHSYLQPFYFLITLIYKSLFSPSLLFTTIPLFDFPFLQQSLTPSPYPFPSPLSTTILLPITLIYNHSPFSSPLSTTILIIITLNYNPALPHHPFLQLSFSPSLFLQPYPSRSPFPTTILLPIALINNLPLPTTLIYNHPSTHHS